MNVDLIGYAHTPFGKLPGAEVEALMREVASTAITDAQLDASEIDAVVVAAGGPTVTRNPIATTPTAATTMPTNTMPRKRLLCSMKPLSESST